MTPKYTEDKRLLGALDYIDDKFIAEVTESYKIFEPSDGKITAHRTLKISLRQFAALAACLILLSAAFPVTNYVVKAIKNFAAGWGSGTTENTHLDESDVVTSSEIFKYVGKSMTIDEVYLDVLENGWVVSSDAKPLAGREKWETFLDAVNQGKAASVLIAEHSSYDFANLVGGPEWVPTWHEIALRELIYDGNTFTIIENQNYDSLDYTKFEYPYLLNEPFDFEDAAEGWKGVVYYLTANPDYSSIPFCEHYAIKPCYCSFSVLYANEEKTTKN